jgi:hypothetical protein
MERAFNANIYKTMILAVERLPWSLPGNRRRS